MQDRAHIQNMVTPSTATESSDVFARLEKIKSILHKECGDTAYRSWIAPVSAISFLNGVLTLSAPTRFVRDWVRSHYEARIKSLWIQNFGALTRLEITTSSTAPAPAAGDNVVSFDPAPPAPEAAENTDIASLSSPLDGRFTFDSYVTGAPNAFAFGAAQRVARGESTGFNPLVIHGKVGMGKTHLLQAIAHDIRENRKGVRVIYMSAEKFTYQFVRALRFKDMLSFKEQLRGVDVLLVDDIQFLAGKDSTQEEFLHTFNALIDLGKQIVVTADRSPAEIDTLDARLRSRLVGGLVAEITDMTTALRFDILSKKCALMKRDVAGDVLSMLAEKVTASVREMEGALARLIAHAELTGQGIDLERAQDLLQDILRQSERRITVEDIQKAVCAHYNIRMPDLMGPRRARPLARPRQMAMYLAKQLTVQSLPDIGRRFGGRDHTTIIHGIRKIEELIKTDASLAQDAEMLKKAIAA